jgi:parallel beta-helix repeat protein
MKGLQLAMNISFADKMTLLFKCRQKSAVNKISVLLTVLSVFTGIVLRVFAESTGADVTPGGGVRGIPGEIWELRGFTLGENRYARGVDYSDGDALTVFDLMQSKATYLEKFSYSGVLREINVTTAEELRSAMANALPGDEIIVMPGEYEVPSRFASYKEGTSNTDMETIRATARNGTKDHPIIVRSHNPDNKAVLKNKNGLSGYTVHISGDYWRLENLEITDGQKGIVLDGSNYSVIRGCEVHNFGQEAIHLRDSSSFCTVIDCNIYDSGINSPGYGEGVYVGSAYSTQGFGYACDFNTVSHCTVGPGVAAECVDIKEQTQGTIIEYCTMYGKDISGENSSTAFVKAKSNGDMLRYNTCYGQDNLKIRAAFEAWQVAQTPDYGKNIDIYGNICYLGESDQGENHKFSRIVSAWNENCTVFVSDNIRIPENPDFTYRSFNGAAVTEY